MPCVQVSRDRSSDGENGKKVCRRLHVQLSVVLGDIFKAKQNIALNTIQKKDIEANSPENDVCVCVCVYNMRTFAWATPPNNYFFLCCILVHSRFTFPIRSQQAV